MAFTPEEIEYYHNRGLMPDWAYYQQNGKSAEENYAAQKARILSRAREAIEDQTSAADDEPIAISIVSEVKKK